MSRSQIQPKRGIRGGFRRTRISSHHLPASVRRTHPPHAEAHPELVRPGPVLAVPPWNRSGPLESDRCLSRFRAGYPAHSGEQLRQLPQFPIPPERPGPRNHGFAAGGRRSGRTGRHCRQQRPKPANASLAGERQPAMPLGGDALSAGEIDLIARWIDGLAASEGAGGKQEGKPGWPWTGCRSPKCLKPNSRIG